MELRLEADTPQDLLARAAKALTRCVLPSQEIGAVLREKWVVEAPDFPSLLQRWIETILERFYEERLAFEHFEVRSFLHPNAHWRLEVEATGQGCDAPLVAQTARWRCRSVEALPDGTVMRAVLHLESEAAVKGA